MTDTEINEAVARKLGWTDLFLSENIGVWDIAGKRHPEDTMNSTVPLYSTRIRAAWEILKPNHLFIMKQMADGRWLVDLGEGVYEADTAPMAICLAFLKLP